MRHSQRKRRATGLSYLHLGRHPLTLPEEIPPYACLPAPYRWMLEENFRDICEAEGLNIRGPNNPEEEWGHSNEVHFAIRLI